jgi:hypothetical protein
MKKFTKKEMIQIIGQTGMMIDFNADRMYRRYSTKEIERFYGEAKAFATRYNLNIVFPA